MRFPAHVVRISPTSLRSDVHALPGCRLTAVTDATRVGDGSVLVSDRRFVTRLVVIAGIALGVWVLACLVMVLLARRLPDGLLKQVVEFLPSCVTAARTLRHDPEVPRRAKVALLVAVVWVVSPIDLIPEFLPVIGPLDDVVAVVLLLRYAARSIPRETMLSAWPTDPRLLERLLGPGPPGPRR